MNPPGWFSISNIVRVKTYERDCRAKCCFWSFPAEPSVNTKKCMSDELLWFSAINNFNDDHLIPSCMHAWPISSQIGVKLNVFCPKNGEMLCFKFKNICSLNQLIMNQCTVARIICIYVTITVCISHTPPIFAILPCDLVLYMNTCMEMKCCFWRQIHIWNWMH